MVDSGQSNKIIHPGFGRCIYCGSDGGARGLRVEHPVPYSLAGKWEITEGSCADCEQITCKLDGFLANNVFFELRVSERLQSRRRTTKKIKEMPLRYRVNEGEPLVADIRIESRPWRAHFPILAPPGILVGRDLELNFNVAGTSSYTYFPKSFRDAVGAKPGDDLDVDASVPNIDPHRFARAIAKIAWGSAIVHGEVEEYKNSEVAQLAINRFPYAPFSVGGTGKEPGPAGPPDAFHSLHFHQVQATSGRWYKLCDVRLFSFCRDQFTGMGPPAYRVVLGDVTKSLLERTAAPAKAK